MGLHLPEDPGESLDEFARSREVAVVCPCPARVLPEPLGWVELRRVGRELMHFQPVAIGFEPAPHVGILVIGGVVLNQNRSLSAVSPGQLFQEREVGAGVEDGVLPVVETGPPELDGRQDLDALALSGDGDFGRTTDSAPSGIQSGVLAKAGFVGENQRPALSLGFFLRLG